MEVLEVFQFGEVIWIDMADHTYCSAKQTSKDHESSSKKWKHDES